MKLFNRFLSAVAAAGAVSLLAMPAAAQAPAPLRIGSTLALTGPLATTALTHKLAGEIYVDQLNARGGCWGARWNGLSRTTSPSRNWPAPCMSSS